jgi:hypothetical protein
MKGRKWIDDEIRNQLSLTDLSGIERGDSVKGSHQRFNDICCLQIQHFLIFVTEKAV